MKSFSRRTLAVSAALLALATTAGLLIAGPLNPPGGAVSSTMKTLAEVEPRIAINSTNTPGDNDNSPSLYKITQPGSYYLTGGITGVAGKIGIEIASGGVTIDLRGFEVYGGAGTLTGIMATATGLDDITILNGSVTQWRGDGIDLASAFPVRSVIRDVHTTNNGTSGVGNGIRVRDHSLLERCTASFNTSFGFDIYNSCRLIDCEASNNGSKGFDAGTSCVFFGCSASDNASTGIAASTDTMVTSCSASMNGSNGITIGGSSIVRNCIASGNVNGIYASSGCLITGNNCKDNTGSGIVVAGPGDTRVEGNNASTNGIGVQILSNGNVIIRNTCSGNTTNWQFVVGNAYGPIVSTPSGAAVNGNTAASALGSTDPNANYSY